MFTFSFSVILIADLLNRDLLTVYDHNTLLETYGTSVSCRRRVLWFGLANTIQVVNSGFIVFDILNNIDSCRITFLHKHKVFPTTCSLILFDSSLWHIQSSIVICI